jgi:hypothetical protein
MNQTEVEARKKWCPMARVLATARNAETGKINPTADATYNRLQITNEASPGVQTSCACIAGDCMAWRWEAFSGSEPCGTSAGAEPRGYCGMAVITPA